MEKTTKQTTGIDTVESPTVRTQSELIADAELFGIKTDGMNETPTSIFNEYVRPMLTYQIGCILISLSSK